MFLSDPIILQVQVIIKWEYYIFVYFGTKHKIGVFKLSNLYEILKQLCDERGITGARMCSDIGYSKNLMTELKSGRKKSLSAEVATKIAKYFGVTVDYLLGNESPADTQKAPQVTDDNIKFALFGTDGEITDEMLEDVKRYAQFIKERKRNEST